MKKQIKLDLNLIGCPIIFDDKPGIKFRVGRVGFIQREVGQKRHVDLIEIDAIPEEKTSLGAEKPLTRISIWRSKTLKRRVRQRMLEIIFNDDDQSKTRRVTFFATKLGKINRLQIT